MKSLKTVWWKHPIFWICLTLCALSIVWMVAQQNTTQSTLIANQAQGTTIARPPPALPPTPNTPPVKVTKPPEIKFTPLTNLTANWPDDDRDTVMTFVHLTDTHVGNGKDHIAFAEAVEFINNLQPAPEFVIITGDLTESFTPPQVRLFQKIAKTIKPKLLLVPGNHDVTFDPTHNRLKRWKQAFPEFATPYRVDIGPLAMIGVDSQLWNIRHKDRATQIESQRQWDQTKDLLTQAQADNKRIMLFHHIPPVPSFYRKRILTSWQTRRMKDWVDLLATYKVEAELTGHFHRDEFYASGDTLLLNAPPICQKYGRRASLRLFRVTSEGLMFRQIYLGNDSRQTSYQMDLHGLNEAHWRKWLENLSDKDLAQVWSYRYTGDKDASATFQTLNRKFFRDYHLHPFDHQPTRGRSAKVP